MHNILLQKMNLNFSWKKSRIECFIQIIISIIENCSVIGKGLALGIKNESKYKSKVQRVYRFFREQKFNYDQIAAFIVSIFVSDNYIIALDRTCWKFGKKDLNILFLVIVIGKISVPVYWYSLDHGGACDQLLMEEIINRFVNNFGLHKIRYLLADREFMGKEWLGFLSKNGIKFAIPLRKDMKISLNNGLESKAVGKSFNHLDQCEYTERDGILWGYPVKFAAYKNDKGELMVVAASADIEVNVFALYRYRWAIERLFKHLKTSGFDIEKSHITDPGRFAKLIAACAIASALIIKNGLIENKILPIKIRNSKNTTKQLFSFFTYGLDSLKYLLTKGSKAFSMTIKRILEYHAFSTYNSYFPLLLQKL